MIGNAPRHTPARRDALERLLEFASRLIPASRRDDWLREWRAELWHLHHADTFFHQSSRDPQESISLAWGIVADAACVSLHTLRQQQQGTAQWCLLQLVFASLGCLLLERSCDGSWNLVGSAYWRFLITRFAIVLLPAIFVAAVSMHHRPRKSTGRQSPHMRHGKTHTRWMLFLIAKLVFTSVLAFLACALVSIPVRKVIGHNGDWLEFLMSTATLTSGIRLAFADQMQRCQRCLRLLRQPVRVGRPSYNLLTWSGMELVCADGHGMLQIPEMQGSWCWYDLWVEQDPEWQSILSSES
jgi:hypothetical protein